MTHRLAPENVLDYKGRLILEKRATIVLNAQVGTGGSNPLYLPFVLNH